MREFSTNIAIESTPERAWSVLADVQRWSEWTASVSRTELLGGTELTAGSRVRIYQPKLVPAVWVVTEWQPGQRFVWETNGPGFVISGGAHVLTPTPAGCSLTLSVQFKGPLGGIIGSLYRNLTPRYLGLEAQGLKARCETRVPFQRTRQ